MKKTVDLDEIRAELVCASTTLFAATSSIIEQMRSTTRNWGPINNLEEVIHATTTHLTRIAEDLDEYSETEKENGTEEAS